VPTENRPRISEKLDSSTKCTFHPLIHHENISYLLQGCSTRDRHLIATGADENKPEIYIWEKKVLYKICDTKYKLKVMNYADQDIPWTKSWLGI
jgi:hypothetical protein